MKENIFRVYCEFEIEGKIEKCMESPASWFLLTQTGKLWTYGPTSVPQPIKKEYIKAIPLFSTGIEDVDENEIYDGDILEYYNVQYTKETREVKFVNNHSFCGWNISQAFVHSGQARIIGNRHENPELMEGNNAK